ncbi:endonuclease/exonuclease/phosphatase family protein [Pseudomonas sp. MPFS]|uniref:endonuclease/exonuclease/phosphatase family protein n=1 Tax=Pseudomonas sp. MPFS TaxID=2795724 RepID=UPI001F139CE3|nr:endonuclease/exonuclease/phosphatase family protein [Pseudomonas sp. MPFS]UMZ14944.1 endonuclease/exonuclease/phosphatase family protein [Pseudomonas sp. MPFS]
MNGMSLPKPEQAPAVASLKVLTVNIHKGFTFLNRRFILPELRDAVRSTGTDLVFLQEVLGDHSHHAKRFDNWPQQPHYEFLADSMWHEFAYGRNAVYPEGEHGNALLSKYPILGHRNLDVSQQGDEQRGLLHSVLAVPGREVHAICVHLGLRETHRQLQLGLLCELVASLPPQATVIVAGDFNDWRLRADALLAEQGLHEAFVRHGGRPARSFPARWPLLRLDRIYVRNARTCGPRVLSTRPWSHLSDHAPLSVEVCL